jgi:hypothetical protein
MVGNESRETSHDFLKNQRRHFRGFLIAEIKDQPERNPHEES